MRLEIYDDLFLYETDETVDIVVLPPEAGDGNVTDKEFEDDGITVTGTETETVWYGLRNILRWTNR
jgi:hypothetical protein